MLRLISCRFCVGKDYYKILEVPYKASQDEIKAKYRQLAKLYHPDYNSATQERFKIINQAYEVIGDPEKRRQYDARNFGQSNSGERHYRSTYNANFHYGGTRKSESTSYRAWQTYGQSARPNQQSQFYEEYIRSRENANRQFREDLDRHYRESRHRMRNILIGCSVAYLLFEVFIYWQSSSNVTYQILDPENGVVYYASQETMQRVRQRQMAHNRMQRKLLAQDSD